MKSSTLLDSVVFQLTPTRTRCDLVIIANGKTEKIASGLLSPFLAHLKSAQEQMAKGGYSIVLQPGPSCQASWFTKGTIERFVRFVSTPEVLERVYTLESEILQLEEAIQIQNKNDNGLTTVEEQPKPVQRQSIEGSRLIQDINEEKAIVLYKPGADPSEVDKSNSEEGQSRFQLLKVLETRKKVLQKEQGMAFARATAAGFDIDHMTPLLSFAESFGASRLMEACSRFTELWRRKHETGQWVEIDAAEAISGRSEFSTRNEAGLMTDKQKELAELASENSGRKTDERPTPDHQASKGQQEFFQGHFLHQMYPPWPVHSPPGTFPMYPAYPVPGMPYYQNHPANSPYIQPPYISSEDPRLTADLRVRQRKHSMDSRDGNSKSETWEVNAEKARSKDDSELYDEEATREESWKRGIKSGKRKSSVVVIRNLNYITSKGQDSGSGSQSASGSDIDEDADFHGNSSNMNHKDCLRSSRRKDRHTKSIDTSILPDKGEAAYGKEDDGGHWQAFQNCLLRGVGEDNRAVDQGMFAKEKGVQGKRHTNRGGDDPLIFYGQNRSTYKDSAKDIHQLSANITRMQSASDDMLLVSRKGDQSGSYGNSVDIDIDGQTAEINSRRGAHKSSVNDEFMIQKQENQSGFSSSDPLSINRFEVRTQSLDGKMSQNMDDDSYIVPYRSHSHDQAGTDQRNTIDMDSEFRNKEEYLPNGSGGPDIYEPVDLCLLPERGTENVSVSYDPALEYDTEVLAEGGARLAKKNKEAVTGQKIVSKSDKARKSKLYPDTSDRKKNVGPVKKAKPSKLSPLEEARARAEKLRSFKADLQKMKKEREEENMKRLEALKLERQKRIAARGTSNPTDSILRKQQARKDIPAKVSPTAHRGSKFSDAEPGSSSPLQRSIKTSRLVGSKSGGNRLVQSGSSLPKVKNDDNNVKPETKVSMARIRRLSEPKLSGNHLSSSAKSSVKARSAEPTSKVNVFAGTENKKISAIMKLDQSKAETLSELRIKTPKSKDITQSKLAGKESFGKVYGTMSSSTIKCTEMNSGLSKIPDLGDADDNPVIEKTVVMLECEKHSPQSQASKEKTGMKQEYNNEKNDIGDTKMVSEYPPIHAPISEFARVKADGKPIESQLHVQPSSCEVKLSNLGNELPKISSTISSEKPYQAPYAQVSSVEKDSSTTNSGYSQACMQESRVSATGKDTVTVQDSDPKVLRVEKTNEALEKPHAKELPKGLKRILKFGRTKHASSPTEQNKPDSSNFEGSGADDNMGNAFSSGEVLTLKNLISQDENPTASTTPKKSSRTFSLLSPFRSKTSGKRPIA